MKEYFPPTIYVIRIFTEGCVGVGSGAAFALTFDNDENIYQQWTQDDDEDITWSW